MSITERRGNQFRFGENWQLFLDFVDEKRISAAEHSLRNMLSVDSLETSRFLDVGSGSGLFSLAARNLGASVVSFDSDPQSVCCTEALRERYRQGDKNWKVCVGDVLDEKFLATLGTFEIVYAWGVLHHTGDMWCALGHIVERVSLGGRVFIAIYNDQRWLSDYWRQIKKIYNSCASGRWLVLAIHAPYFLMRQLLRHLLVSNYERPRGMAFWRDVIDWLGGFPFEVARPEQIFEFFRARNFVLEKMITVGGRHGCNQFVLRKLQCGIES